ncbi:MAG: PIG-L family deacetylase [Spirochaetales bacterium]|nr:PIG-L family deacetylase [Spirochaetales bacterium]
MNILAIGCHPDDLEIACFGTLGLYKKQGHNVFTCHVANGNLGHKEIKPDELRTLRRKETLAAAELIGAESFTIDVGDCTVESDDQDVVKKLIEVIRYANPDLIITHDPADYMRDHIETSRLTFTASFSATVTNIITRSPEIEKIVPIFYMDTLAGIGFMPTEYVDITETIELKLKALSCHKSQIEWMREHDKIDFPDFVRTCSKFRGLQSSVPYAEAFRQAQVWPRITTKRLLP